MARTILVVLLAVCIASPALAQRGKEPLVDQVKKSIDSGIKFLRDSQRPSGDWEVEVESQAREGGWTALATLALLNSGVQANDPAVQRGLKYLRGLEAKWTYVRALQAMALSDAGQVEDRQRIQEHVDWLLENRVMKGGELLGWTYSAPNPALPFSADNSNTQYALLGLWAGQQAGAKINRDVWVQIRDFYLRTQQGGGGWPYLRNENAGETLTMTAAGLSGLFIAARALNVDREQLLPNGTATNCGKYPHDAAVAKGFGWISSPAVDRLSYQLTQRTYYNMYGIERVGRLSGRRFIGRHDWYREGCQYLVKVQDQTDGSWHDIGQFDKWKVISTSFALLFLSKGRTPILISKVVHTDKPPPRPESDTDWNNDRYDLANLVDFASREVFKKMPLGWQALDMLQAAEFEAPGKIHLSDEEEVAVTAEMLQSPILYITGHRSPLLRFTGQEKNLLRRYVENGGFIMAEACCGSPEFDQGFKTLVSDIWRGSNGKLEPLPGDHPVWKSVFDVTPGKPYQLMGLSLGCKTVLVYSPQDLSCRWESNNFKDGDVVKAFQLGANIIAYATGKEPPRPKLTHVALPGAQEDPKKIPRGYFKVAQLIHRGDWQPAPKAMRNLMDHLRRDAQLDVVLKTEELSVAHKNVIDFKFLYMHGRGDFDFNTEQVRFLKFNLDTGGMLFADACCGNPAFDTSFRKFVKVLFPKEDLVEVPLNDRLFSKELNGVKLDESNIKCRRNIGKEGNTGGEMRNMAPLLEGIKVGDRWVLLYSRFDIGCALERHTSSDCLGYDPESANRIAGAAVLYLLELR